MSRKRTFYTETDIEDLSVNGIRQLEVGLGVMLTDAARERADELGIALVTPGNAQTSKPTIPDAPVKREILQNRPAGCQHGPFSAKSNRSNTAGGGGPVVDQLVEAVSALKKRGG